MWQIRESCGQELHVLQVRNQAATRYNYNITIERHNDHGGCEHKKFTGAINSNFNNKRPPQNSAEGVTNIENRPRAKGAVSPRRATPTTYLLRHCSSHSDKTSPVSLSYDNLQDFYGIVNA